MTDGQEHAARRAELVSLVRRQDAGEECWARAETICRTAELRRALADLGVVVDGSVAVALMAAAVLLAETGPEWGGDYRDGLAEVARIGAELLDG